MRLAFFVDSPTNRFSGFPLKVQAAFKPLKVAGENAFGDLEWPQMSSDVWKKGLGGFQSPPKVCKVCLEVAKWIQMVAICKKNAQSVFKGVSRVFQSDRRVFSFS